MEKSYKGACIKTTIYYLFCTLLMDCDMFLEAFHSFKIIYLHHKQNKHVHSLLVALIKIYIEIQFSKIEKSGNGQKQPQDL